jgi:4-amino-4-deoxy-L-arabinose transferase-like glycosyltransferase
MLESGDYVVVRFQDDLRAKKPAGIYWLQSAAVRAFSTPESMAMWPYRLPSLLAAVAAVLLTFRFGSVLLNRRAALFAAIGLASSVVLAAEAHVATTDATLLAFTTLVQGCLGLIYLQSRGGPAAPWWAVLAFWVGTAGAIMTKGPITLAITALTLVTLCAVERDARWLRSLRPLAGIALTVVLVAPWMVAVHLKTHGVFLARAVGEDLLPKMVHGEEGHGAPPGMHALIAAATLWPASLFLVPALGRAWRERLTPTMRFLLAWAVPSWVMFELVPTKLWHYTLPLAPALMMMIGAWLAHAPHSVSRDLAALPRRVWAVLWGIAGLLLAGAMVAIPVVYGSGFSAWALPGALAAVAALFAAWWYSIRRCYVKGFLILAAAGGIVEVGLLVGVAPQASALWVSQRAAATLRQVAPGAPIAVAGYSEPSLVFETSTDTKLLTAPEAAAWMMQDTSHAALVEERELAAFRASLTSSAAASDRAVIEGFDYSNGKRVRLHLFAPRSTALSHPPVVSSAEAAPGVRER